MKAHELRAILSRPGTLEVMDCLLHAPDGARFTQIQQHTHLPPRTLVRALRALESAGFVERHEPPQAFPPQVTYRATPRLQEARALVRGFWQLVHGEGEARRA